MRGASVALGACGGIALGFVGAMGPGGLDARLYWRTPSAAVQAARPETVGPSSTLETGEAAVAAERGTAETAGGDMGALDESTEDVQIADSESPPPSPPPVAVIEMQGAAAPTEASAPDTFPPLSPELQESFRQAWFEGARAVELGQGTNAAPGEAQPVAEQAQPAEQVDVEETEVVGARQPAPAAAPVNAMQAAEGPVVPPPYYVPGYPTELQREDRQGTDPNFDPFFQDAVRLRREFVQREQGGGLWSSPASVGNWSGQATTGGAYTGGAWSGAATTGGATTGGATTGAATTGGATTGGAWTGAATTGGAYTGGAWSNE